MSKKVTADLLGSKERVAVNCRISGGVLAPALYAEKISDGIPGKKIVFGAYSQGAGEFYACTDSKLYISGSNEIFLEFLDIKGKNAFIIEEVTENATRTSVISGSLAIYCEGVSYSSSPYGANLSCGVMHCGRLFGIDAGDGCTLRWSGEGGVKDWEVKIDGSGSLRLSPERGTVFNLVEYGKKIIAVREYGLTVLNMFGVPENFSVDITNTEAVGIIRNTACVAGGKLFFCTAEGLYSYDGGNITRVAHSFDGDIKDPTRAIEHGGKYYLSCTSESAGGRALLCYNPDGGEAFILDICADFLMSAECIYVYNDDGIYMLKDGGRYSLTVSGINFGTQTYKTFKRLKFDGCADISVSNGRLTRTYAAAKGEIRPKLRGRQFTVQISGDKESGNFIAEAEVTNAI